MCGLIVQVDTDLSEASCCGAQVYDNPQRHHDGRGERHHPSQHIRPVGVNVHVINLQVSVVAQVEDEGDLKRVKMVSVITGVFVDSLISSFVFVRTTQLLGTLTEDNNVIKVEICFSSFNLISLVAASRQLL